MPSGDSLRIGLFGGSFDPVHLGHLAIAEAALDQCSLERVVFLPCWQSPHKESGPVAPSVERVEMLRLATAELPWAEISTWELERDSPSFSWMTAEHFAAANPGAELFWILGTDQWQALERWAEPNKLAQLLTFIVFPRGAEPKPKEGFEFRSIDVRHPASSTEIRRRLATGEDTADLLDPAVASYINERSLYRG